MLTISLPQAQLFNILSDFFGKDRVVFGMTVYCISEGREPSSVSGEERSKAKTNKCLFTIIDAEANPKLVLDYAFDTDGTLDLLKVEDQKQASGWFKDIGLPYIMITRQEYLAMLDPNSGFKLFDLLNAHLQLDEVA